MRWKREEMGLEGDGQTDMMEEELNF